MRQGVAFLKLLLRLPLAANEIAPGEAFVDVRTATAGCPPAAPHRCELARLRCQQRTREELLSYAPARPLALRDELRVAAMRSRCGTCGACPRTVATLNGLSPPAPVAEAIVLRLAG